jgi:hypothetical protein
MIQSRHARDCYNYNYFRDCSRDWSPSDCSARSRDTAPHEALPLKAARRIEVDEFDFSTAPRVIRVSNAVHCKSQSIVWSRRLADSAWAGCTVSHSADINPPDATGGPGWGNGFASTYRTRLRADPSNYHGERRSDSALAATTVDLRSQLARWAIPPSQTGHYVQTKRQFARFGTVMSYFVTRGGRTHGSS